MNMTTGEAFMKLLHEPATGTSPAGRAGARNVDSGAGGIGQHVPVRAAGAS